MVSSSEVILCGSRPPTADWPVPLHREPAMDSVQLDVGEVTRLLRAAQRGEPAALERLIPLVYDDLRRLARRQLGHEYVERTLDPDRAGPRVLPQARARGVMVARDRAHFLALAARAMRQVLVDHARERKAAKRGGGGWERTTLTDGALGARVRSGPHPRPGRGARDARAAPAPGRRMPVLRRDGGAGDRRGARACPSAPCTATG